MAYGVYGDPITIYSKLYSTYSRGTIVLGDQGFRMGMHRDSGQVVLLSVSKVPSGSPS